MNYTITKLTYSINGRFVGIGNPADFDIDDENLPEII